MANRIPKVCTASQGTIHRPSPSARGCLPSKPRVRAGPRSATSTCATMLCVLRFWTCRRGLEALRPIPRSRVNRSFLSQREICIMNGRHSLRRGYSIFGNCRLERVTRCGLPLRKPHERRWPAHIYIPRYRECSTAARLQLPPRPPDPLCSRRWSCRPRPPMAVQASCSRSASLPASWTAYPAKALRR
jgi:hypothetical protein